MEYGDHGKSRRQKIYDIPELENVSEVFHTSVLNALGRIETEEEKASQGLLAWKRSAGREKGNVLAAFRRLALPMTAALFLCVGGVTAYSAFLSYRERMAQMNQEELEDSYIQGAIGHTMHYSRLLRPSERARYETLNEEYENQGHYPQGSITILEEADEYTGEGIGLLASRATYMLPEEDLTDEELLQLIDATHKQSYSLERITEQIAEGEISDYPDWQIKAPDGDGEKIIAYEGSLDVGKVALGSQCFYLAGTDRIEKMAIGSSVSETFFARDFGGMQVYQMTEDPEGGLYVLLGRTAENGGVWFNLLHLDKSGEILYEKDMTKTLWSVFANMACDKDGNLYLTSFQYIFVLDDQGQTLRQIEIPDDYTTNGKLCTGADGAVYLATEEKMPLILEPELLEEFRKEHPRRNILLKLDISLENGFTEIAQIIIPEQIGKVTDIRKGKSAGADFLFFNSNGVYAYQTGEETAVRVMSLYEAPLEWEGAQFFVLEDGRFVFVQAFKHEMTDQDGIMTTVPESVRFFYTD